MWQWQFVSFFLLRLSKWCASKTGKKCDDGIDPMQRAMQWLPMEIFCQKIWQFSLLMQLRANASNLSAAISHQSTSFHDLFFSYTFTFPLMNFHFHLEIPVYSVHIWNNFCPLHCIVCMMQAAAIFCVISRHNISFQIHFYFIPFELPSHFHFHRE